MPKTKSHMTIGQLNAMLGRGTKEAVNAGIKAFRHTTSSGTSAKPVQRAPKEFRSGERTIQKPSADDGMTISGVAGTDTTIGGAGKDRLSRRDVSRIEGYIRDAATKRGINPNVAVAVAKSEGLKVGGEWQSDVGKAKGRREKSYGPFQLNIEKGRLGVQFMKETGLDPRDESTVEAQIDYSLDHAAKHGWGAWFGAANVGIGRRQGLANARPVGVNTQVAQAAPSSIGGLLASFFGTSANAEEAPQGLGAEADYFGSEPTKTWGPQRDEAVAKQAEKRAALAGVGKTMAGGLGGGMMGSIGIDASAIDTPSSFPDRPARVAPNAPGAMSNEANVQRMEREAGMYQPGIASNDADVQRMEREAGMYQPPAQSRFGTAPASNQGVYAQGKMSMQQPDMGAIDAARNGVMGLGGFSPSIQSALAAGPAGGIGSVFSTAAAAADAPAPGATAPYSLAGTPGITFSGDVKGYGTQYGTIKGTTTIAPPMDEPTEIDDAPTIAAPNEEQTGQTISGPYPEAPAPPTRMETLNAATAVALDKMGLGFVNKASNAITGGLGSLFSANMPTMSGPDYGSGLGAMQQAMGGAPGGFASSRSNPGYSYGKTATGGVRYGPYGWQTLDEAGETTGALRSYGDNKTKGLGGFLSGLFGGESKSKDKDKDGKSGGLGKYSGNGLY
jgi:hypothetical protein